MGEEINWEIHRTISKDNRHKNKQTNKNNKERNQNECIKNADKYRWKSFLFMTRLKVKLNVWNVGFMSMLMKHNSKF